LFFFAMPPRYAGRHGEDTHDRGRRADRAREIVTELANSGNSVCDGGKALSAR